MQKKTLYKMKFRLYANGHSIGVYTVYAAGTTTENAIIKGFNAMADHMVDPNDNETNLISLKALKGEFSE